MTKQHETTLEDIRTMYSLVQIDLRSQIGSTDARKRTTERLEAIQDDLSYLIGERGFEEFVASRLEEYRRTTDKTLCSCWRATCPIKQGKVPPGLQQHGGTILQQKAPSKLLAEYLQRHDGGEALELIRKEWAQMVVRVDLELSDIRTDLRRPDNLREDVARNVGVDMEDVAGD